MSKSPKSEITTTEPDALEIIELATNDIDTLAKAFDLITEVCKEFDQPELAVSAKNELPVQ